MFKKFKKYSIPSKVGIYSFFFSIIIFLIFTLFPIANQLITNIRNDKRKINNNLHYTQTLLALVDNDKAKSNELIDKYFSQYSLSDKKDILFWYGQREYGQESNENSLQRLIKIISDNNELTDTDTLKTCLVNGLITRAYNSNLTELYEYIDQYPDVVKYVNIPEVKYLKELNTDEETCLKVFFNNDWGVSPDRFLRMLQYNILTGVFNKYDNTLLQCIVLGYKNELYPQEFSNYFLSTHMAFGNLWLFDNRKRSGFNKQLSIAYSMLDKYKETKNYLMVKNLLDTLSKATGFINEKSIDNPFIRKVILESITNNQVLCNYDFYTKGNITYIALYKGELWNIKNNDELIMKPFFQNGYFQIIEVKNKNAKNLGDIVGYGQTRHFVQIKKCGYYGFFLISSDGTYEGKNIVFYSINDDNVTSQDLYTPLSEMDYHSFAYYTYNEGSKQYFSWNYEYENKTQVNIERKIPGIVNINFDPENNKYSMVKYVNDEIFNYIENIYIESTQLQIRLLNTIVINNKKINDENLIKIMKDPVEYYSRNLIDNTLLWIPKAYQPKKYIFIFEDRTSLFEDSDKNRSRKEYVFLIDNDNEDYQIESIYYSEDGEIKKTIL
ncbi:MAG: hypothetical protein LKF96_01945 [Treponema sp.]|nr:hypothetical protein [Treponema sp.]